jgi:hypothetical protein
MTSYRIIYDSFVTPEKNGKKIGLFRIFCAIIGGLIVSYLGMVVLAIITPSSLANSAIVPLLFYPFTWACVALWISLSPTKLSALLKVIVLTTIFSVLIFFFFKVKF